ncbi:MAG: C45 family autoproteolytic acyltransferase/hydrolase [Candidatus Thorarchaeota archaeon]
MIEITLKGSHFEIGVEIGKLFRKAGYSPPPLPPERKELASECEKLVQKYTPTLWEEIEGFMKGGDFKEAGQFELTLLPLPRRGCTIFAIAPEYTSSGKTIFARNYDWAINFQELFTLIRTYPDDAFSNLACTDLVVGRYGGINEAGLSIGLTAISGYPDDKPGIALHLATRWILDNCSTTKEAVAFMKRIPHFRGNNYLIADKDGDIALVEACPERVMVTPAKNGLAFAANRFQSPEMLELEVEKWANPTTIQRHKIINDWFSNQNGGIEEVSAQQILSGVFEQGEGVCCKYTDGPEEWGTIWSWTALLGDGTMNIADGAPSNNEYKSYSF